MNECFPGVRVRVSAPHRNLPKTPKTFFQISLKKNYYFHQSIWVSTWAQSGLGTGRLVTGRPAAD